jgi:hypothetical protein
MEKKIRALIDRIESDTAVLLIGENEDESANFPRAFLPEEAKEGDILKIRIKHEPNRTRAAKEQASALIAKLKKRG